MMSQEELERVMQMEEAMKSVASKGGMAASEALKQWQNNFNVRVNPPGEADNGEYVDVDGYRVNRSYQYYDPELDQVFDFSTPYGRRSLNMMRKMKSPWLTEDHKNEIMQEFGNDATEEEWEDSRRFVDNVNQSFGLPSAIPPTEHQVDKAGQREVFKNDVLTNALGGAQRLKQSDYKKMQMATDAKPYPLNEPNQ